MDRRWQKFPYNKQIQKKPQVVRNPKFREELFDEEMVAYWLEEQSQTVRKRQIEDSGRDEQMQKKPQVVKNVGLKIVLRNIHIVHLEYRTNRIPYKQPICLPQ
jgi:hypothetical protein